MSAAYATSRWTSDNDLSCSTVPLGTFYLQSESLSSPPPPSSSSLTIRPSQSLISLPDASSPPPPIPPRPKKVPTELRSTRVAEIVHRFETRDSPSIDAKKPSKPQPIIVYERIPVETKSISRSTTSSTDSTCSSPHELFSSPRFSASEVNLADQYRRMSTSDVIHSDTNLSTTSSKDQQLINTNLPLRYKRDSFLRLYG